MKEVPFPEELAAKVTAAAEALIACGYARGLVIATRDEHGTSVACCWGDLRGLRSDVDSKIREYGK